MIAEEKKITQQKYLELQILQQYANDLQKQLQILNQQLDEMQNLDESLESFSKTNGNEQIFSQLGPGVFIEATLKNSKEIIVNIGSDLVVKKTIPETRELVKAQKAEIKDSVFKIEEQLRKMIIQIQSIQEELQNLSKD